MSRTSPITHLRLVPTNCASGNAIVPSACTCKLLPFPPRQKNPNMLHRELSFMFNCAAICHPSSIAISHQGPLGYPGPSTEYLGSLLWYCPVSFTHVSRDCVLASNLPPPACNPSDVCPILFRFHSSVSVLLFLLKAFHAFTSKSFSPVSSLASTSVDAPLAGAHGHPRLVLASLMEPRSTG